MGGESGKETERMKMMSLEELAREGEELAAAGASAGNIVEALAMKGLGEKRGTKEMREGDSGWMAGVGAEGIHPWRLSDSDVNGIARLCQAIHAFGEGRMRTCRRVLENPGVFGKEVRVAAWRALTGMRGGMGRGAVQGALGHARFWWERRSGFRSGEEGVVVLWEWARLRSGLRVEGEEWVRCLIPDAGAGQWQGGSRELQAAFEQDRTAEFEMRRALEGARVSLQMVAAMLRSPCGTETTLRMVLEEPKARQLFSAKAMLFFACAWCGDEKKTVKLAEALCGAEAGIAEAVDGWGLTPLDYASWGWSERGWHWDGQVEETLLRLGCDPLRENRFGFSFADVKAAKRREEEREEAERREQERRQREEWERRMRESGLEP